MQARKRVGVDLLIRNERGKILLVDPHYKPDWDLPGGMAEANESPQVAAHRELTEELGLIPTVGRLLVVDWVPPHDPWDDSLMFVFDGGVLTERQITTLRINDGELRRWAFVPVESVEPMLRPDVHRRLGQAVDALTTGSARYLVHGSPPAV